MGREEVEMGIKFGTDGWRGVIADDFTFDNVRTVAQAISDYLTSHREQQKGPTPRVAVGYDTRFMSNRYAEIVTEVLTANKIKVVLTDKAIPTQAISFIIKKKKLDGGIMVTASHNAAQFNGLKFKSKFGGPGEESETKKIEGYLFNHEVKSMPLAKARSEGWVAILDIFPHYVNFLKHYVDMDKLKRSKLRILVDSMYGTADRLIEKILAETSYKVTTIHEHPDPLFGGLRPEPIEHNLGELRSLMMKGNFDIGLANDGDADRMGVVNPKGEFITTHQVFSLLLLHFVENRKWKGDVVKTLNVSSLIDKIAHKYRLTLFETPVGFKHICKIMKERNVLIGGEESGKVGFKGYLPDSDGILIGLLLLEMLETRKRSIIQIMEEMEEEYGKFYQLREDLEYSEDSPCREKFKNLFESPPKDLLGRHIVEVKDYDGIKLICEDGSWLLLRLSGTEPILRIYGEAASKKRVKDLIQKGKQLVLGDRK